VADEVGAVVKDAGYFDRSVRIASVKKEMARVFHGLAAGQPRAAQRDVISSGAIGQKLGAVGRTRALRVSFDIRQSLPDEVLVAKGRSFAELARASFQNGGDIAARRYGEL
jgi:hypothetical protein